MYEIKRFLVDLERRLAPYLPEEKVAEHLREAEDHLRLAHDDGVSVRGSLGSSRRYANEILVRHVQDRSSWWFRFSGLLLLVFPFIDVVWGPFLRIGSPMLDPFAWKMVFAIAFVLAFLGRKAWPKGYLGMALALTVAGTLVVGRAGVLWDGNHVGRSYAHQELSQQKMNRRVAEKALVRAEFVANAFARARTESELPPELQSDRSDWSAFKYEHIFNSRDLDRYPKEQVERGTFASAKARWAMMDRSGWPAAIERHKAIQAEFERQLANGFSWGGASNGAINTLLVALVFAGIQMIGGAMGALSNLYLLRKRWLRRT